MTVVPEFGGLARVYRWMEYASFGPVLGWVRGAFLQEMLEAQRVLVLGDGDGRFTARLLQENAEAEVVAVDASARMLAALRERAGAYGARVRTVEADVRAPVSRMFALHMAPRTFAPAGEFDGVVTHFLLDCLTTEDVRRLALQVSEVCAAGAVWVVSEFAVPEGWFGRVVAGPVVAVLYWIFGVMTGLRVRVLPEYRGCLQDAGFVLMRERKWLGGLLVSEIWRIL